MNEESVPETDLKKKRKAKIIAGFITFVIFCFWLFYFIVSTKAEYVDKKPFALLDDLKQNAMKPIENIKNIWTGLSEKFNGEENISTSTKP